MNTVIQHQLTQYAKCEVIQGGLRGHEARTLVHKTKDLLSKFCDEDSYKSTPKARQHTARSAERAAMHSALEKRSETFNEDLLRLRALNAGNNEDTRSMGATFAPEARVSLREAMRSNLTESDEVRAQRRAAHLPWDDK